MAKRNEQRKLELIQQISEHRGAIAVKRNLLTQQVIAQKEELKEKINVPKRIKGAIASNPRKWFIGSAIAGLLVARIFRKPKPKAQKELIEAAKSSNKSFLKTAAMFILKPMIKSFIMRKVRGYAIQRLGQHYNS